MNRYALWVVENFGARRRGQSKVNPIDDPVALYLISLGQQLRSVREEKRMTQRDIAERSGVAMDVISRLENAHYRSPGLRTLIRVATALGTPLGRLFAESDHLYSVEFSHYHRRFESER